MLRFWLEKRRTSNFCSQQVVCRIGDFYRCQICKLLLIVTHLTLLFGEDYLESFGKDYSERLEEDYVEKFGEFVDLGKIWLDLSLNFGWAITDFETVVRETGKSKEN